MNSSDLEIERKFLVKEPSLIEPLTGRRITQGYLSDSSGGSLRVRLKDDEVSIITMKGRRDGNARVELECEIPLQIGRQLLDACGPARIEKTRYDVADHGRTWAIDVFHGANAGLIVAEVELERPDEAVELPLWCGLEVTDDDRYYNARLVTTPFTSWH